MGALKELGFSIKHAVETPYEERKRIAEESGLLGSRRRGDLYEEMGKHRGDKSQHGEMSFFTRLAKREVELAKVDMPRCVPEDLVNAAKYFALGGSFNSAMECVEVALELYMDMRSIDEVEIDKKHMEKSIKYCEDALSKLKRAVGGHAVNGIFDWRIDEDSGGCPIFKD